MCLSSKPGIWSSTPKPKTIYSSLLITSYRCKHKKKMCMGNDQTYQSDTSLDLRHKKTTAATNPYPIK